MRSGHRRGDVLDRRRHAGELREVPAARRLRQGDPQPAARWPTRSGSRPRRAVPQLALHPVHAQRQRRGDGRWRATMAAEIGVDRLCWELTDHPEDMFSRRFVPGLARARRRSGTRSGTTTTSATPSPAPRRARGSTCDGSSWPSASAALPLRRGPGEPLEIATRVTQPLDAPVPGAGQLRPPPGAARRAALRRGRHAHQPRLRARLAAGARCSRARRWTCRSRSRRPRHPGATR